MASDRVGISKGKKLKMAFQRLSLIADHIGTKFAVARREYEACVTAKIDLDATRVPYQSLCTSFARR